MEPKLSILQSDIEIDLTTRTGDVLATLAKAGLGTGAAALGIPPFIGTVLAETLTQFIPNQKISSIAQNSA